MKKSEPPKTLASTYKSIKGFGSMPEPEKKKVKINRFIKVLGRDK